MQHLEHFLGRPPDGRVLYRYRISDTTYVELREHLRATFSRHELRATDSEHKALFCVFAAEWWRREHLEGPWSWDGIKGAIGVGSEPYTAIEDAAETGLRVLQRRVFLSEAGHRLRLITLACEGGLPLRRLEVAKTPTRTYLREVLEHLEALGMSGDEPPEQLAAVAERHDGRLPLSLRRPVVHRLVGALAGRAWALRQLLPEGVADPVAHLDVERETWRDELPLVVSDASAEALLRGLMKDVARIASGRGTRVRVVAHLTLGEERAQLTRRLEAPLSVSDGELQRVFGSQELPRGGRLQVRLRAEAGDTVRCGVLSRSSEDSWSFQPKAGAQLSGEGAADMVSLVAASRTGSIDADAVEGASPLGPLPWVFRRSAASRSRWELVAVGSTRRRESELLVAVPDGLQVEGGAEGLSVSLGPRRLFRVQGSMRIRTDAGLVRIAAGTDDPAAGTYELRGRRFEKVTSSKTAWLGMPYLVHRVGYREEEVDLEVRGKDGWRPARRGRELGALQLRARRDGEVVFRAQVRVVPSDLTLHLEVGDRRQAGAVVVQSEALVDAAVPADPRWATEKQAIPGGFRLVLTAVGDVPSRVPLTLDMGGELLKGDVPFPQRTLRFEHPDGTPVAADTKFHVKHLGGIRAVGLSPHANADFGVEVQARGLRPDDLVPARHTKRLERQRSGEHVLDLRDLQTAAVAILDATERLDAYVRLRLFEVGGASPARFLSARRYDWTFRRDVENGDVVLEGADPDALDGVVVEARPFAHIGEVETLSRLRSARFEDARWVFNPAAHAGCTWLITGRDGTWHRCRPLTFWGGGEALALTGLRAAFELPDEWQRHEAIAQQLDGMCEDWSHPDWQVVDDYLRLLGDLPAATFDLIRVIARHPKAPACAALRASALDAGAFLRVVDGLEELIFLWEAIPMATWEEAFDGLTAAFPEEAKAAAEREVAARGLAIAKAFPSVGVVLHHWARKREVHLEIEPPAEVQATFSAAWAGDLFASRDVHLQEALRHHGADHAWPRVPAEVDWPEVGEASLQVREQPLYRRRVLDAPAVMAMAALGSLELSPALVLFLEEVRAFDEDYFRQCFYRSFCALVARDHGAR